MNDSDANDTGLPALDTLARADALAALRAAGDSTRLSALIAAQPNAADALADATMLMEADEPLAAPDAEPGNTPAPLSPGTQRGLLAIFGAGGVALPAEDDTLDAHDDRGALVAEAPAPYSVMSSEPVGLLALAQEQGLDAETLAARIMLSAEAVRWLDQVALPLDQQPDALVAHLAGALGATRAQIGAALAEGARGATPPDAPAMLSSTSASLTPAQRDYWAALLAPGE